MSKRALIGEAEYLEPVDYERFSAFPQEATDDITNDAIGYPAHWSGFTVTQKSAQVVTVSTGRYYEQDKVFKADAAVDINLTLQFPNSATQERWIGLIAVGETVEVEEDRGFRAVVDPETVQTVVLQTPVIEKRIVTITPVAGVANIPPALLPEIAPTDACIAFVRVTTQGVQEIIPGDQWRVKSLFEVEARVGQLELRVSQLFEDTASLRTDLGNVSAAVGELRKQIPNPRLIEQFARDIGRLGQLTNLPDEARNYFYDNALIPDGWDFTAGGYFRIDEGIRFQYEGVSDNALRLANYSDPALKIWNNRLVLPAYTEVARITSPEGKGSKDIAGVAGTIRTAVKKTKSHQRIRYGETVTVCENTAGWQQLGGLRAGQTFKKGSESWVSLGQTANPWNATDTAKAGHAEYAVRRVIKDTVTRTYVAYNTETFGLNGAVHGQTFLCSQVMVATSVDLNFTKVGATGDVLFCLAEVNASGAPDYDAVLAKVELPRASIVKGWNKFTFEPTLLDQGARYAWFVVTTGDHRLMTNSGNAFGGGSLFVSSDGVWSQGSVTEDFSFRLNAAKFAAARTVVQFESLNLAGGMTEIDMIYKAWEPAATSLVWEILPTGETQWIPLDARTDNPLANLPPQVLLRAVFVGTEDVAPAIDLDTYARAICGRMRSDMRAITTLKTFGFSTTEAQIVLNMDNFDDAKHTADVKVILSSGTVVDPAVVVEEPDPAKPGRVKITADFTLPGGTTSARARVDATTTDVTDIPFGQDIQLNAF